MFTKKPSANTELDNAIDRVLFEMQGCTPESKEYAAIVDQLVKLHALKLAESPQKLSPDTKAMIAANLFGIAVIVGYERANVVTSKALSFILKLK